MPSRPLVIGIVLAVVAIALVRNGSSGYALSVWSLAMVTGGLGMSLSLLVTHAGMPSLAQAAFYGTGGYAVGVLAVRTSQDNLWVGLLVAAVVAGVLALALGAVSLRTRGIYFQIITLSFTAMIWGLAVKWRSLTGGDDGLVGIYPPSLSPLPGYLVSPQDVFLCSAIALLVICLLVRTVRHSTFGHVLVGIRDSESRMAALGYRTTAYRLGAFVIAGVLAAIPGALLTYQLQFSSPAQLNFVVSIQALLVVVLGAGTLMGPALAGIGVVWLQELLQRHTSHWLLVLGGIYIAVALLNPPVLAQRVRRRLAPSRGRHDAPEGSLEVVS
ncbi:branched-chain amino acid ABC transporter permease [Nocardioides sp. URHA0032]|uniref:branched-chain amino acid ABC transporter permease n=1 Tax=Nocardioides sp. URHA0032 TaxID=1380388 RepID=UPI00048D79DD|nr:branched-chain amino acid ABC transporter permease [Nocardioides sp. URHA0032]